MGLISLEDLTVGQVSGMIAAAVFVGEKRIFAHFVFDTSSSNNTASSSISGADCFTCHSAGLA